MNKRIASTAATAVLALGLLSPTASPTAASPTSTAPEQSAEGVSTQAAGFKKGYSYTCVHATPNSQAKNMRGKDPKTCKGWYQIVEKKSGKEVLIVNAAKDGPGLWGVLRQGVTATNKWCASHSATCQVAIGVGIAIAQGILTNNDW